MRQIVVIDDDKAMCDLIAATLEPHRFVVHTFVKPVEGVEFVRTQPVDVVLTDVRMPGMDGIEVCRRIHEMKPGVPVIVLTGFGSMETVVEAIRVGAYDFLSKPVGLTELELSVKRAADLFALTEELRRLRRLRREGQGTSGMIGSSAVFEKVLADIPKAARSGMPVLIVGETGTGKELMARALHVASPRAKEPFVAVNCSAIPENLVESELFGHVRGAFTDAKASRAGLFVEAGEGTLFLDEVGDLPSVVQPKLLRALQEHRIRPVGADSEVPLHCQVIAATNVDLRAAVDEGLFRSDLYFRLAVIRMTMPPLRDRAGDILELAHHFVRRAAERMGMSAPGISTAMARALLAYHWPGNVRELENAMERAVAMGDGKMLAPTDLPEEILAPIELVEQPGLVTLAELERAHIHRVLKATNGNKKAAAEILGLDRRTLYRKLDREGADD